MSGAQDPEELEVGLPAKGLNQIMKDTIPEVRIANESRDLLHQCCVEFIHHLSRQAQTISVEDHRKTINHEDLLKALEQSQFPSDYLQVANSVLDECKVKADRRLRRKNSRLDKCGIPEEELYRQQQELIERARAEQAQVDAEQLAEFQQSLTQVNSQNPVTLSSMASSTQNLVEDEDYDAE